VGANWLGQKAHPHRRRFTRPNHQERMVVASTAAAISLNQHMINGCVFSPFSYCPSWFGQGHIGDHSAYTQEWIHLLLCHLFPCTNPCFSFLFWLQLHNTFKLQVVSGSHLLLTCLWCNSHSSPSFIPCIDETPSSSEGTGPFKSLWCHCVPPSPYFLTCQNLSCLLWNHHNLLCTCGKVRYRSNMKGPFKVILKI